MDPKNISSPALLFQALAKSFSWGWECTSSLGASSVCGTPPCFSRLSSVLKHALDLVSVEVRDWHGRLPLWLFNFFFFFLETRSFTELEVYLQGILAAQWASVSPALELQARATKPAFSVADAFLWLMGIWTQVLMLKKQALVHLLSHLYSPFLVPFSYGDFSQTGPWHTSGALCEFNYLFKTISWSTYTFWDARRREAPLSG